MRTEHYLFNVLEVTSESRVKFVDSKEISLNSWYLNTDRSKGGDFDVILTLCFLSGCLMYFVLSSMLFSIYMDCKL